MYVSSIGNRLWAFPPPWLNTHLFTGCTQSHSRQSLTSNFCLFPCLGLVSQTCFVWLFVILPILRQIGLIDVQIPENQTHLVIITSHAGLYFVILKMRYIWYRCGNFLAVKIHRNSLWGWHSVCHLFLFQLTYFRLFYGDVILKQNLSCHGNCQQQLKWKPNCKFAEAQVELQKTCWVYHDSVNHIFCSLSSFVLHKNKPRIVSI